MSPEGQLALSAHLDAHIAEPKRTEKALIVCLISHATGAAPVFYLVSGDHLSQSFYSMIKQLVDAGGDIFYTKHPLRNMLQAVLAYLSRLPSRAWIYPDISADTLIVGVRTIIMQPSDITHRRKYHLLCFTNRRNHHLPTYYEIPEKSLAPKVLEILRIINNRCPDIESSPEMLVAMNQICAFTHAKLSCSIRIPTLGSREAYVGMYTILSDL